MKAKKFIIETSDDCGNFGILVLFHNEKGMKVGSLEIFSFKEDSGIRKIGIDDLEHDGWKEFATELVKKANDICKENDFTLWIY